MNRVDRFLRSDGGARAGSAGAPRLGVLEWFRLGEHERVERVLGHLQRVGIRELRTGFSWADWCTPDGPAWYDWLIPTLAHHTSILPCVVCTPPSEGVAWKCSAPPREPKKYADFIDVVISRYGDHFSHIELWNEPNNLAEWDWTMDPEWGTFCSMIGMAAHWVRRCGKKAVLGGMSPPDPNWLRLLGQRGVLDHIDVVGLHGFPGTWEPMWRGWDEEIARVRAVLDESGCGADVWITETGYSTWRRDERRQLEQFIGALGARSADRVYWYALEDLDPDASAVGGFHNDEREYHFGMYRADGRPKLLARALETGGIDAVRSLLSLGVRGEGETRGRGAYTRQGTTVITGGAGFIGTNLADRIASEGRPVVVYDDLSRAGVERNAEYLKERHADLVDIRIADVRDRRELRSALRGASSVFHFAAQVAVTTSLDIPVDDLSINVEGTVAVLEELRRMNTPVPLVFTSTNKVYGNLLDVRLEDTGERYMPADPTLRDHGVCERRPLEFCSPYGCSKGAADQYVLDYAKSYGIPTAVFRMSCIYGPHQCGTEDQGWIAHFLRAAMADQAITLYGDGKQVRDALFVDDLVDAFLLARGNIRTISGRAFNIGGGAENTLSLLELLDQIGELNGQRPRVTFGDWRTGDQRWYVSDTRAFQSATGWSPRVGVREGVARLHAWLAERNAGRAASVVVPASGVKAVAP